MMNRHTTLAAIVLAWLPCLAFGQGTLAIETDLVDVTVNRKVIVDTGIEFAGDRLSGSQKTIEEQTKTEKAGRVIVSDEVDPKFVVVVVSKSWDEEVAAQYYRDKTWLFVGTPGRYKVEVFTTDPEFGSRRTFSYVTLPGKVDDTPPDDEPGQPPELATDYRRLSFELASKVGDAETAGKLATVLRELKLDADLKKAQTQVMEAVESTLLESPSSWSRPWLVEYRRPMNAAILSEVETVETLGKAIKLIADGLQQASTTNQSTGFQIINAEPVPFRQPIAPFEGQIANGYRWTKICNGRTCHYQWVRQ